MLAWLESIAPPHHFVAALGIVLLVIVIVVVRRMLRLRIRRHDEHTTSVDLSETGSGRGQDLQCLERPPDDRRSG
jgi:hypothetical protein